MVVNTYLLLPPSAALSAQSISQTGSTTGNSVAGVRLNTSGVLQAKNIAVYSTLMTWLLTGLSSDHEVFATDTGVDTMSTGTFGTWLSGDTNPEWTLFNGVATTVKNGEVTMTIRHKTTLSRVSAIMTIVSTRT